MEMIVINGLIMGGQYAILSIGFSLAFGTAHILNLSHTSFYMFAAFLLFIGITMLGLSFQLSSILAILIVSILGMVCYKIFFDRIKEHETTVMITSLALAMLFQEIFLISFKGSYLGVPPFFSGFVEIIGVRASYQQLFAIGTCLVTIIGIWILLSHTKVGSAIRAISQDREAANLMGIDVNRICLITMGISIALASVAAIALAPLSITHSFMWVYPLVIVLAAVVLGGLGSVKGVVLASFILGFVETAVVLLIPEGGFLKGAASLSVMVVVLLVRPEGLFGVVFEEERL